MKKVAILLVLAVLAVAMVGCGETAEQTSGSAYNTGANRYK
jgi:uncharacterized lipoprotein YehR (DUF1307 family)